LSRLRTFALFATLVALVAGLAACGGGSSSEKSDESPQKVADEATFQGVKSGTLDMSLGVDIAGAEGGHVDVTLSGPFQAGAKNELPQLDMDATAKGDVNGESVDFEGGLTLLSDRAFVSYEGDEYEVDPTTFTFVKSAVERAAEEQGAQNGTEAATACQEAAAEKLHPSAFIQHLSNEGSAEVGGTATTQISGDLDLAGAIDALAALTKDPACSAALGSAGGAPSEAELDEAKSELGSALKKAHADFFVGDDDIVRKVDAELTVEPKEAASDGPKKVDLSLEIEISGVNEEQSIEAPSSAKPLEQLFQKLGVNPTELLNPGGAGGLGGLLEGVTGGGGSSEGKSPSGGQGQQKYLECLRSAKSSADIAKCSELLE
jgi:hypothetical protein